MPISIYPPTLQSTQPAFLANTSVYPIYFTLQSITPFDDIGHIQIRIVRQSNNKSIVNTSQYPDGAIYKAPSAIGKDGSRYFVSISSNELAESWTAGYLYKVQMRFGINAMYNSISEFATWKQQQIDQNAFSEWSTVMIIKAIDNPTVTIINAESVKQDVTLSQNTEATLTPLFQGEFVINSRSKESLDKYEFNLYSEDGELLETSGLLQHMANNDNNIDSYRFKTVLVNNETYNVRYRIITVNGYGSDIINDKSATANYSFLVNQMYLGELEGVSITIDDNAPYCSNNGCINLYCSTTNALSGSYIITRSSEESNYTIWEDLQYVTFVNKILNKELIYQDFTVESGIQYKYAFQQENSAGLRTSPIYENGNPAHSVNFEYSYLYRDGVQLRFQFNQTLSSFKHTTLRSKQDTLGDKYPHLVQNGNAYYAEFPISGLISFQMDNDQTFFFLQTDGYYYNEELIIPKNKFVNRDIERGNENPDSLSIDTNLTDNNIFIERKFREKVEEFLNDFTYKLYKSPTEGNIIVGLLNVSLTPNNTLGRMIYNFSATAYEVLDNTLENLNEFGIIDIGAFSTIASDEITRTFGQISGIYGTNIDLYALIREQEEVSIGGGYKISLNQVTDILVEQYPIIDLTAELLEQTALRAEALSKGEDVSEYDAKIKEYENLIQALQGPDAATISINVNGQRILIAPNRVYHLSEDVQSLTLNSSTIPVVINYICETHQVEDTSTGVVSAIDTSRIWGQISGVFTGTDSVLKTYNYEYQDSETFRIYSNNNRGKMEDLLIKDSSGQIIIDNTNYNVYKTINIYDIIKEETQHQVELIYGTKFELTDDGQLTDGKIYYTFNDIILFDIETDEGSILYISQNSDGSNATTILVGPTCRYTLNPLDNMIKYIALKEPRYCVINYKCLTNQMRMK